MIDAAAYLMLLAGTVDVTVDCRRIAVLTGRSAQAANVSLHRLMDDGWFTEVQAADLEQGLARRITLASEHVCTGETGHVCAVTTAPDGLPPDTGGLRARLERLLVRHQVDLWHRIGHHAERTLAAVEDAGGRLHHSALLKLGHGARTAAKHLRQLTDAGLLRMVGDQIVRTAVALTEAARTARVAGRTAGLAVKAVVDQAAAAWWAAEVVWSRLDRTAKRRRGPRSGPAQEVCPGTDPAARAYPRRAGKSADHGAAWAIEAQRLGASGLFEHAVALQESGAAVDSGVLSGSRSARSRTP